VDPSLDAEIIDMAWQFYRSLGIGQLHLLINSIGCKSCRPVYLARLKRVLYCLPGTLCQDCQKRLVRNPLRLLDCKNTACQKIATEAPRSYEQLCPDCSAHFEQLKKLSFATGIAL
jgi:histidyl-tRNA synthetase